MIKPMLVNATMHIILIACFVVVSSVYKHSIHLSSLFAVRIVIRCKLHETTGNKATLATKSNKGLSFQIIARPMFPNPFPWRNPYLFTSLQGKNLIAGRAIYRRHHHHHHHHHIYEGLGVFTVPWSPRWSWSLHLFLGRPMFLRLFGLYCSACFGILFVSILWTCCSHFLWYCFISRTMFCAPVFSLIHWFFSLSSFVIPSKLRAI